MDSNTYGWSCRFIFNDREFVISSTSPISIVDACNDVCKFFVDCVDQSKITFIPRGIYDGKECCLDG